MATTTAACTSRPMVVNCCAASAAATAANPPGSSPHNRPHKVQYEVHTLVRARYGWHSRGREAPVGGEVGERRVQARPALAGAQHDGGHAVVQQELAASAEVGERALMRAQ